MDETREKLPCDTLTAEELLCSKGIKNCILEECERSLKTLPKNGKKHFEPSNSWLENVQIEKELKNRGDLLNIERVERVSELASAEWIPAQKKALVTKRSGQDWSNFGLEKNGSLYLLAEEALFLLETNCLELTWNGVPCSIQQAYEILIDDSVCTLEEYRVYSQLIRYGYRIQRYFYEDFEKNTRSDEFASSKRKIIVEPENGLRMCDNQLQSQRTTIKLKESLIRSDKSFISLKDHQDTILKEPVEQDVHDVVGHLLHSIESQKDINKSAVLSDTAKNNTIEIDKDNEEKNRNSKPEIISDETLLCNIKILRDSMCNSNNEAVKTSKWPGTRIQRNVKLLPKRSDKMSLPEISIIDSSSTSENLRCVEKRKINMQDKLHKKPKLEVIDLSDDEIQELPHSLTRMDILNMLPNVALQMDIKEKISRRYIPHNIRPQKTVYEYSRAKISRMQENDRRARQDCKNIRNNSRQNASNFSSSIVVNNRGNSLQNQRSHPPFCNSPRPFYQMHRTNISLPYPYRFPYSYGSDFYMQNRITQNVFHNLFVAFGNHGNVVQQSRSLTIQMNNFAMPFTGGYRARHFFTENQQFRLNPYQNFLWQQRFCQRRIMENTTIHNPGHSFARRQYNDANRNDRANSRVIVNRPSFTTRLGATSWTDLKRKWSEEKTITIDDEDYQSNNQNEEECNKVQIMKLINPLVGPRNAASLTEVFNKLAIIKPASERLVRRKKNKYKISYNVYSCSQHYRKANPGQPLYSLVVIRKENSFLQPVELNRLQQDAKGQIVLAYVSMSISYIQPGIITMPNVT